MGSEEGDEIDVLIGSHLRRAVVGKVDREREADDTEYTAPEHIGAPALEALSPEITQQSKVP